MAKPGPTGSLIDIGCGNGAALANFSSALPNWSLYGSDLAEAPSEALRNLNNFSGFYSGVPRNIEKRFDIVTLIHALEHMIDPAATLSDCAALVNPDGLIFVEVPNVETSPFDLLVADHMMHFSPTHLSHAARRAGLSTLVLRDDVLPKEITMLAVRGGASTLPSCNPLPGLALIKQHVDWLSRVLEAARAAAMLSPPFGIFGTSISGMWLYGGLRDQVSFFIDEDRTRIGGSFDGRPILAPSDAPKGSSIFVPLVPSVAAGIAGRLNGTGGGQFVLPPPMV
jgi:SAM-dependent methyltransferase